MKPEILGLFCRIALAAVFLFACVHKILYPADFAQAVFYYQLLPSWLVNVVALALPWTELVVAIALLAPGRFREAAAVVAIGLLLIFNAGMVINIVRGVDISCGCFSTQEDAGSIGWSNVFRNFGYIVLACFVVWVERMPRPDKTS